MIWPSLHTWVTQTYGSQWVSDLHQLSLAGNVTAPLKGLCKSILAAIYYTCYSRFLFKSDSQERCLSSDQVDGWFGFSWRHSQMCEPIKLPFLHQISSRGLSLPPCSSPCLSVISECLSPVICHEHSHPTISPMHMPPTPPQIAIIHPIGSSHNDLIKV